MGPIKLYTVNPLMTCTEMEAALLGLPNYVIDGVSVNSTMTGLNSASYDVSFLVYFTGTSVAGPQNLLMVDTAECLDGCTPQLTGVDVASFVDGTHTDDTTPGLSYVTEAVAASATTTRASAAASRATPATSARCRRRSSKRARITSESAGSRLKLTGARACRGLVGPR